MRHRFRFRAIWMKPLALVTLAGLLAGCLDGRDLDQPAVGLGDFTLGHNVVIAPNLTMGPLSRPATAEEWSAALTKAIDDRFGRYEETEDTRVYHFGISVEGFVLAQVGVPLVLQPNSVMIFRITVWDDAFQAKMNPEPHQITVLEAVSPETVAGSGLTQTREEQLENLAVVGAKQIEEWLVDQMRDENWFQGFVPKDAVIPVATAPATPDRSPAELEGIVERANSAPAPQGPSTQDRSTRAPATQVPATRAPVQVIEPVEAVTDPEVRPASARP